MTCCVAALADYGKSIVLVADKMIGLGMIETEPDISKIIVLQKGWRVLISGDDVAPAYPIIEAAKKSLIGPKKYNVGEVMNAVYNAYSAERLAAADSSYLKPAGIKSLDLIGGRDKLPESIRIELINKMAGFKLEVSLLVAGFDSNKKGYIFSVDDDQVRGRPQRQDITGWHAIGSGAGGAMYMMAYRALSPSMPLRAVLYYAVEAKYFGEKASGVGVKTDVLIMRSDKESFRIKETTLEDKIFPLCARMEPRSLVDKNKISVLNELEGKYIATIPKLKIETEAGEKVIKADPMQASK
jgi:20S proteasome alpha/beta subunit